MFILKEVMPEIAQNLCRKRPEKAKSERNMSLKGEFLVKDDSVDVKIDDSAILHSYLLSDFQRQFVTGNLQKVGTGAA